MTAMTTPDVFEINGRFEHGQVVLDMQPSFPEGTRLHVRFTTKNEAPRKPLNVARPLTDAEFETLCHCGDGRRLDGISIKELVAEGRR